MPPPRREPAPAIQPDSGEPPLSAARWTLASILAVASIGGLALSLDRTSPALPEGPRDASMVGAASVPARDSITRLIDVNAAPAESLTMLPGIGPVLAERIVADREANGPFRSLDELDRVRGIGPRTIEKLRPLASASG